MRKIVEMSWEEFNQLKEKTDWLNLKVGEIYVDKENGTWKAFEVIALREVYGGNEPELAKYDLSIV